MADLTNRRVAYEAYPGARRETGRVVRQTPAGAFVLYDGDTTPGLTRVEDLTLSGEEPR